METNHPAAKQENIYWKYEGAEAEKNFKKVLTAAGRCGTMITERRKGEQK